MKKLMLSVAALLALTGLCLAQGDPLAQRRLDSIQDGKNNGDQIKDLRVKNTATVGGALTVAGAQTASGAVTVAGKLQADGELEANADVDINLGTATEEITIDQTNVAGTATVPLIKITDARTGATANTAAEATLVITPSGTHAVSVTAGISAFQAVESTTITATSDAILPALSIGDAEIAALDASKLTGNIAEDRLTNAWDNIIQTGTCTNDQAISFTPAFTTTPVLSGTWVGNPAETNGDGGTAEIYVKAISASGFTLSSVVAQTNAIHWAAIQVP